MEITKYRMIRGNGFVETLSLEEAEQNAEGYITITEDINIIE